MKTVQKLLVCVLTQCEHSRRGALKVHGQTLVVLVTYLPFTAPPPIQDFTKILFRTQGPSAGNYDLQLSPPEI